MSELTDWQFTQEMGHMLQRLRVERAELQAKLLEEQKQTNIQISKNAILRNALETIKRGHHDPTPTRRLFALESDAGMVDSWWQAYYLDNDRRNKEIAEDALKGTV